MDNRFEIEEIRSRIKLSDVVSSAGVVLKKQGRDFVGLCPFHAEKTASFSVSDGKGVYHCYGCAAGGDLFGFIARHEGIDFSEALKRLRSQAGLIDVGEKELERRAKERALVSEKSDALARRKKFSEISVARKIWDDGEALERGTAAYLYLKNTRGIDPDAFVGVGALRAHSGLPYWVKEGADYNVLGVFPALLGALVDPDAKFVALHITYLEQGGLKFSREDKDGKKLAAKKVRGAPQGGMIRIGRPAQKDGGLFLGGAEGIETALSVRDATGLPVWPLYSLGNFAGRGLNGRGEAHPNRAGAFLPNAEPDETGAGFVPPEGITDFIWFGDGDGGDLDASAALVKRGIKRLLRSGIRAHEIQATRGNDFNDILKGRG